VQIAGATLALEPSEPDNAAIKPVVLSNLYLPLALGVDELLLEPLRLRLGAEEYLIKQIGLQAQWQGAELDLGGLELVSADWGSLAASGEMALAGNWPLTLDIALDPDRSVVPDFLQARTLLLQLTGQPGQLDIRAQSPGDPRFDLDGQVDLLDSSLPFTARAKLLDDTPLELARFAADLPPALAGLALQMPLEVQAQGSLASQALVTTLALSGAGYEALTVAARVTHADNRVLIEELVLSDADTDSAVALEGTLHYGDGLAWQLEVASTGVTLPALNDYVFGRVAGGLAIEGAVSPGAWQLALRDVDLAGEVNNLPALVNGQLSLNGRDYVAAGTLALDVNGAQLRLQRGESADAAAALSLQIADLSRWEPGSRGRLELEGELRAKASSLQLSGSLANVRWRGLDVDRGQLTADLVFTQGGSLNAQLRLEEVLFGELYLDTVNAHLQGTRASPVLEVATSGRIEGRLQVAAEQTGEQWSGQLITDGIDTPLGTLALNQAVTFTVGAGTALIAEHCWELPASQLCADEWRIGASGGGRATLDGDLSMFAGLLPQELDVSGPLSAEIMAEWAPSAPLQARATLASRDGQLSQLYPEGQSATFTWQSLDLVFNQGPQGLDVSAGLVRDGKMILDLAVVLPPDRDQPLAGMFQVNQLQVTALRP
ncbi:MAG TPA: hypothetical protein VIC02_04140, partial [Kineobactrum sp.]